MEYNVVTVHKSKGNVRAEIKKRRKIVFAHTAILCFPSVLQANFKCKLNVGIF